MICHESRDKINTCFLKKANSRRIILKVVVFGAPLGALIYVLHVRRVSLDRVIAGGADVGKQSQDLARPQLHLSQFPNQNGSYERRHERSPRLMPSTRKIRKQV